MNTAPNNTDNPPRASLEVRLEAMHHKYWQGFELEETVYGEAAIEIRRLRAEVEELRK